MPVPEHLQDLVSELSGPKGPAARLDVDAHIDEYKAIVEMLVGERTPQVDAAEAATAAGVIAAGCLGPQHLWQEIGLSSRSELGSLLEAYFQPFAASNTTDVRWKKYVYIRLNERGGFETCRPPHCNECEDYAECFGSRGRAPRPKTPSRR